MRSILERNSFRIPNVKKDRKKQLALFFLWRGLGAFCSFTRLFFWGGGGGVFMEASCHRDYHPYDFKIIIIIIINK